MGTYDQNKANPASAMEVSPEELLACDFISAVDMHFGPLCNSETVNFHNIRLNFQADVELNSAQISIQYDAIEDNTDIENTMLLGKSENPEFMWSVYRKLVEILDFKDTLNRLSTHFADFGCTQDTMKIA